MIVFEKIRWKNFLATGDHFTEIELDSDRSTLIVGTNGAGKSTILDAITFVLSVSYTHLTLPTIYSV